MISFLGHPSFEKLSSYADAELTGRTRDRVASHLAGCARCRDTVRFIRELGEVARSLPAPEPPADALPRLLARRAAGERVILPTSDPVPIEPERRRAVSAIAATLALFVAGSLLVSVPRLGADRSQLEFSPKRPQAGTTVQVRYVPGSLLASEPVLVLRGRLRFANGNSEIAELGTLVRGADGVFHGAFSLPDSAVYGVLAIEDTAASRVDSNNRRFWELLVHGEDGRPRYEALRERTNELFVRNPELAHETARTGTVLYPMQPWGWFTLFSLESEVAPGPQRDSLIEYHRQKLRELDRYWSEAQPTADDAAFLAMYALGLEEREIHRRWRSYLVQRDPTHRTGLQLWLSALRRDAEGRSMLQELERVGAKARFWHREFFLAGFLEALRVRDTKAAFQWAERYLAVAPDDAGTIAKAMAEAIPPGEELHAWLRDLVTKTANGKLAPIRQLYQTAEAHKLETAALEASVRQVIARLCFRADDMACALEHLRAVAAVTWNPAVFDTLAQVLARQGRVSEAAEFLARVAIDPLADSSSVANAHALGRSWSGEHGWARALGRAHEALASYMAPYGMYRRIASDLELIDATGARVTTGAVLTGGISVVAFWSPLSAASVDMVPQLERAAESLRGQGIKVVGIQLRRARTVAVDPWKGMSPSVELYFDPHREVEAAFDQWGEPEFFVVDRAGVVRYRHWTLGAAIRQATSLRYAETQQLVAP